MIKKILLLMVSGFVTLQAGLSMPKSFSAHFLQKVTNPKKKVIQYTGTVLFTSPSRIKWSYVTPTKKEVCSSVDTVSVVDHDLEQVSFFRIEKGLNLASIVKKARHHKGNLYVAKYLNTHYTIAVDTQGRVEQIAYKDNLDNVVNVHFKKIKYSKKSIPANRLRCPYPKEYDIIQG